MARRIPGNRFEELVRGATEVFIARGYRLTQMSDVAAAVGVAKGTLYGYVESKDALLGLCLRAADLPGPIPVPSELPLRTLPAGQLGMQVKEVLGESLQLPALERALATPVADDPLGELGQVIGEFYDLLAANRHRIKLLDRCMDYVEIRDIWQTQGREQSRLGFARYIALRVEGAQFRRVPSIPLATRLILETCVTWAVHIHWDRAPESYAPDEARANAIDFLVRGLVVSSPPGSSLPGSSRPEGPGGPS